MSPAIESVKNVVLVHGGFADGSGWQGVYNLLKKDGYNVSIVDDEAELVPRVDRRQDDSA